MSDRKWYTLLRGAEDHRWRTTFTEWVTVSSGSSSAKTWLKYTNSTPACQATRPVSGASCRLSNGPEQMPTAAATAEGPRVEELSLADVIPLPAVFRPMEVPVNQDSELRLKSTDLRGLRSQLHHLGSVWRRLDCDSYLEIQPRDPGADHSTLLKEAVDGGASTPGVLLQSVRSHGEFAEGPDPKPRELRYDSPTIRRCLQNPAGVGR